ncbi:hypothetical protein BT93_F0538 [Corymbia citriodora subsp. variegata]|nr:hypothetical protein BT93_F0538 [Corymbia citriodora subsp. variegata]
MDLHRRNRSEEMEKYSSSERITQLQEPKLKETRIYEVTNKTERREAEDDTSRSGARCDCEEGRAWRQGDKYRDLHETLAAPWEFARSNRSMDRAFHSIKPASSPPSLMGLYGEPGSF